MASVDTCKIEGLQKDGPVVVFWIHVKCWVKFFIRRFQPKVIAIKLTLAATIASVAAGRNFIGTQISERSAGDKSRLAGKVELGDLNESRALFAASGAKLKGARTHFCFVKPRQSFPLQTLLPIVVPLQLMPPLAFTTFPPYPLVELLGQMPFPVFLSKRGSGRSLERGKATRCTKCGIDNAAGARFCNQCATPLGQACPKCAHLNAPDAKFCAECAEALTSDVSKSTARKSSTSSVRIAPAQTDSDVADGERKTVTALFADIKGSTELEQDLDPEKRARSSILRSS